MHADAEAFPFLKKKDTCRLAAVRVLTRWAVLLEANLRSWREAAEGISRSAKKSHPIRIVLGAIASGCVLRRQFTQDNSARK